MSFMRDILTGKDNKTHDIAKWVMVCNAIALIPILIGGVTFYFYGYLIARAFDLQTLFTAVLTYEGGVAALLTSGAAAIFMKKDTEPDGTVQEQTIITKNQAETTVIKG